VANTLYVGNLPFKISDEQLSAHFAVAGDVVEVTHIRQRDSDRSAGCGFVEMSTAEAAQSALATLNGVELDGRELKVCLARP
jgi:RNA recognition motif-containing protein